MKKKLFVILGNQLFHPKELKKLGCEEVFMAEDYGLCTYEKHHKLKLYLYLTSMREYKDCLLYTSPSPRDVEESRMPSSA